MRLGEHRGVVVAVAGGDDLELEFPEALHRLALLVRHAQPVVDQHAFAIGLERVAEERRPAQLPHQRPGELVEGVGKDHHLVGIAQRIEKGGRACHRPHRRDHLLDVGKAQPMLAKNAQAPRHQLVVVGLVPRCARELRNSRAPGEFDPDFRNEDTFEVETDDLHDGMGVGGDREAGQARETGVPTGAAAAPADPTFDEAPTASAARRVYPDILVECGRGSRRRALHRKRNREARGTPQGRAAVLTSRKARQTQG